MDVCVSLVALPRWNATLAWWRLEAAGERMERITDTEDRGQRPGEGRVHSTQPEHGGPASVGHMRQHSHSDGILNPYLHRFYCTSQGLNRCSCSFIMSYDDMNLSLSEEDIFQIESIK